MSLHHMILGCLMDAPSYGYEIRKRVKDLFQRSHSVNEGQLYAALKKMEQDGLVRKEISYQDKTPPRKVFYLTDQGKEELFSWISGANEPDATYKFDFYQAFPFLERFNYFKHISDDTSIQLLNQQIIIEQVKLEEFQKVKENMQMLDLHPYRIRIVEFGLAWQETKLEWLESTKNSIAG